MSALSKFAGSVLLQAGGSYEPQRKSNFALIIEGDGLDNLILQLKDVDIPAITLTQKGIKYFNETMHYAGSVTPFADLTVNYHDYIDRNGLALLSAWYKQGFDPKTGAIGWAKDYKKNGQLPFLEASRSLDQVVQAGRVRPRQRRRQHPAQCVVLG